jgi:hypothetical protein
MSSSYWLETTMRTTCLATLAVGLSHCGSSDGADRDFDPRAQYSAAGEGGSGLAGEASDGAGPGAEGETDGKAGGQIGEGTAGSAEPAQGEGGANSLGSAGSATEPGGAGTPGDTGATGGAPGSSDPVAPEVILNPLPDPIINDAIALVATATDDVGIEKVEFYFNGTLLGDGVFKDDAYRLTAPVNADGAVTFMARAYDAAGNTAQASLTSQAESVLRVAGGARLQHDIGCPPSLAFDAAGTAFVAHTETASVAPGVRVSKLVNNVWKSLGVANDPADTIYVQLGLVCPTLAVSSDGVPFVAFAANNGGKAWHSVRRLNGKNWEKSLLVQDKLNGGDLSVAIDSSDRVVLARALPAGLIEVQRLEAATWKPLASSIPVVGNVGQARVATRPDGTIVLAAKGNELQTFELHDDELQQLAPYTGGPKPVAALALLDLNVDAAHTILTYTWFGGGGNWVIAEQYDADSSAWSYLGTLDDQAHDDDRLGASALLDGKPVLTREGSPGFSEARRWKGASWTAFEKLNIPFRHMDLQTRDGQLFCAYRDGETSVTVARLFIE